MIGVYLLGLGLLVAAVAALIGWEQASHYRAMYEAECEHSHALFKQAVENLKERA